MCAGVYVDRSFRDLVVRKIHNDARHRLAPSYGFDLVPVVRHAWHAWLLDMGHLLAILATLFIGWKTGGLLALVIVLSAVGICRVLRLLVREFPEMLRQQTAAVLAHWRLDVEKPPDRPRKVLGRRVRLWIVGFVLAVAAPFVVSTLFGLAVTSAVTAVLLITAALVACAVVAGTVRHLRLMTIANTSSIRPATLTRREKTIDAQQNHLCVIFHRPPHRASDIDPIVDLPKRGDVPSPFVGGGKLVNRWLPPLTVQLLRPGNGRFVSREYTTPPFLAHELVEVLRSALAELAFGAGRETLPGLRVRDRIYVADTDFTVDSNLVRDLGKLDIWAVIDNHRSTEHHFLETSVPISGGELVATVLIQVSLKGRTLTLDVATCALTRTPGEFHVVDWYAEQGYKGVLRSVARSVAAVPADVARVLQVLEMPVVLGWGWWAQRDHTTTPRRRAPRPLTAAREVVADAWSNTLLDRTTIYEHMKIVEQRILKATEDFLRHNEVDTSLFERQSIQIINSGVLNMAEPKGGQGGIGTGSK